MTGCLLCGPLHGHHPTRRPEGEPYFDQGLRLWLCAAPPLNHHARAHEVLRAVGLDLPPAGTGPVAYRLSTLAVHCRWAADNGAPFGLADVASGYALAELLEETVAALIDQRLEARA